MSVPNGYTSAQVVQAVPTGINSALVFVARTTFTAASSLAMTNVFSSTYDNYLVQVTNLIASANSGEARVRLGTSGSADTGANYQSINFTLNSGNPDEHDNCIYNNETHFKFIGSYVGSTNPSSLNIIIQGPNLARYTTLVSNNFGRPNSAYAAELGTGSLDTSTQYTDFFLVTAGAPTHSCTITVYGFSNS